MSYLDRNWKGQDGFLMSFLHAPHISEIIIECAERQIIQDIYHIPERPVHFIQMCNFHGVKSDVAHAFAPLQRDTYRLFKVNHGDAFTVIEDILNQKEESPYHQSYIDFYDAAMETAVPVYRNNAVNLFKSAVYYTPENRNHLHDMAKLLEDMEYDQIKKLPAERILKKS